MLSDQTLGNIYLLFTNSISNNQYVTEYSEYLETRNIR